MTGNRGFTFVEILVAVALIGISIAGILTAYSASFSLAERVRAENLALNAAIAKCEEIKACNFDEILINYTTGGVPGPTFSAPGLHNGVGAIEIVPITSNIYRVHISVSWQERGGRVVGEDRNLNGILDEGEDTNGNGWLDSPASITTIISR